MNVILVIRLVKEISFACLCWGLAHIAGLSIFQGELDWVWWSATVCGWCYVISALQTLEVMFGGGSIRRLL